MSITFDDVINIIPRYPKIHSEELISALSELNSLIGLEKIKEDVYGQLAYAIMLLDLRPTNKNRYMLHTLITGPPGVGKSNLAHILGKIWAAIGIIGRKPMERKQLSKEQNTIYHLMRNSDFILDNIEIIRSLIPPDVINQTETDSCDKPILKRINWIAEMCKDCTESAAYVSDLLKDNKPPIIFKKVTRADLIGKWQGHTAEQTRKILMNSLNGVLFIDEAYQLITGHDDHGDNFGAECLTTINEFISEHADDMILIFAGYEDTMEETIFRVQPGLRRRFMWHFNIEPYSPEELASIIVKQATDDNWTLDKNVTSDWLASLVSCNKNYFNNYGGDTSRLVFYSAIEHACNRILNPDLPIGILNKNMINGGFHRLKKNSKLSDNSSSSMYL